MSNEMTYNYSLISRKSASQAICCIYIGQCHHQIWSRVNLKGQSQGHSNFEVTSSKGAKLSFTIVLNSNRRSYIGVRSTCAMRCDFKMTLKGSCVICIFADRIIYMSRCYIRKFVGRRDFPPRGPSSLYSVLSCYSCLKIATKKCWSWRKIDE